MMRVLDRWLALALAASLALGGPVPAQARSGLTVPGVLGPAGGRTGLRVPPAAAVGLSALSLDAVRAATTVPYTANIVGGQAGSTFTLSGAGAAGLAVSGTQITGTPTATGAINITELASDGVTSRPSNAVTTVGSPVQQAIVGGPQFPSVAVANSGGTATQTQTGRIYPVLRTGNQIRIRVGNHYRTAPDGTIAGPSSITLKLGVSSAYNVAATQVLFSGASSITLAASQTALSDPINVTNLGGAYVSGDYLYVTELCTYASAPANFPGQKSLPLVLDADYSETGTALTDRTTGTWTYTKTLTTFLANHVEGIVGMTAGGPVVGIVGDSISSDQANDSTFGFFPGWTQQALARAGIPWVNVGITSQTLYGYMGSATQNATNWAAYLAMMVDSGVTHALVPAATNDFNNGTQNATQVTATLGTMKGKLDAASIKLIPATIPPRTNAGNTADGTGIVASDILSYNATLRTSNGVGYGYYDLAPLVWASPTTNLWRTDLVQMSAIAVASGGTGYAGAAIEAELPGLASGRLGTITSGVIGGVSVRRQGALLPSEVPVNPVTPSLYYSNGAKATQAGTGANFNITWSAASPTSDGTHPNAIIDAMIARDAMTKLPQLVGAYQ